MISLRRICSGAAASIGTAPWALPATRLSPKASTGEERAFVARAVDAFGGEQSVAAAKMPPSAWYVDERFLRAELAGVFGRTWQYVCRADQVAEPRQYVATWAGNGEPVVVVRSPDGVLRAFANVCRHHAARVASGEGVADAFVCPYHAWTYNLHGRLTKATRMKGIEQFSAAKIALPPLAVEQFGPFVFVRCEPPTRTDAAWQKSVAELMAPLARDVDALVPGWSSGAWRAHKFLKRRIYTIDCNWKVYCDNYLDGGYHIPHLHHGLNAEIEMDTYSTTLHDSVSVQTVRAKAARVGDAAVYGFVFPNLAVNVYGAWMDTNLVLPVDTDRCVIVFDWYHKDASPTQDEAANAHLLAQLDTSRSIQDEDVAISVSVQSGIQSASYDVGRYSPGVEMAEYHFHRLIRDALRDYFASYKPTTVE